MCKNFFQRPVCSGPKVNITVDVRVYLPQDGVCVAKTALRFRFRMVLVFSVVFVLPRGNTLNFWCRVYKLYAGRCQTWCLGPPREHLQKLCLRFSVPSQRSQLCFHFGSKVPQMARFVFLSVRSLSVVLYIVTLSHQLSITCLYGTCFTHFSLYVCLLSLAWHKAHH